MKKLLLLLTVAVSLNSNAQTRTVGTTLLNETEAYEGYTLLSPLHSVNNKTYLINNCGDTVHSWTASLSAGLTATLLPNGNLLRPAIEPTATVVAGGSGGRIQVFNWDNTLLWDYKYSDSTHNAHHEVVAMPNGNFLILSWDAKDSASCVAEGRDPNTIPDKIIWSEKIVEVQPTGFNTGNIVWAWDVWDHLVQNFDSSKQNYGIVQDHPELLNVNYLGWSAGGKDWLHANAINYNAELDQIVMSCRYTHEIYIIDHSTTTAEAAGHSGGARGKGGDFLFRWGNPAAYMQGTLSDQKLYAQHNSAWIPSSYVDGGKIMIFNNGNTRPGGDHTSIDIINPKGDGNGNYILTSGKFSVDSNYWSYTAPQPSDFFSAYIGGAERLPNGNTLICNGTWGNLFEIDQTGEKVWEYVSPVTLNSVLSQGSTPAANPLHGTFNWVFRASRYAPSYSAFNGKTLTSGAPVEQNPLQSLCDIATGTEEASKTGIISIYPNPANSRIMINGTSGQFITIYDIHGSVVKTIITGNTFETVDVSDLNAGVYVVKTTTQNIKLIIQ